MTRVSLKSGKVDVSISTYCLHASGLCKCSIKVPFVVWELMVNNNNNDIFNSLSTTKVFHLQMHRLLLHLVHVDTCIYFCLYLFIYLFFFFARA